MNRLISSFFAVPLLLVVGVVAPLVPLGPAAQAQPAEQILLRGNNALLAGDPEAAMSAYETLAESGIRDADLEYNQALARAARGELGHAILHLERASRLRPSDSDSRQLLETAREALGERQAEQRGQATVVRPPLADALTGSLSADFFAAGLWLCLWLACLAGAALQWLRSPGRRLAAGTTASLSGAIALSMALGLGVKLDWGSSAARAIVVRPDAALRQAPAPSSARIQTLLEGSRGRIVEAHGTYHKLRTPSGAEGWVERQDIGTY